MEITQIQTHELQNNNTKDHQERDDDQSSSSKWQQHLTQDISESILRRLCFTNFLKFGLVCSSWNATLNSAIKSKQCHPNPQIPFLMLCPQWIFSTLNTFLVEVNKKTFLYPKRRLYPTNQLVLGSIDGWLIMLKLTETYCFIPFFFNPVLGHSFELPSMKEVNHLTIKKMAASSTPNNNNNDSVFVVCLADDRIISCKIADKSWSLIKPMRMRSFSDIVVIGNLLYVQGNRRRLDEIEIYNLNDIEAAHQKLVVLDPKPQVLHHQGYYDEDVHLAHDVVSGDLMLVVIKYVIGLSNFLLGASGYFSSIKGFRVMKMKLDRSSTDNGVRWVEVEDLGDCVMFFDQRNCRLISTVGLEMENVRRNCIYFAEGLDVGVFCLSDKSFRYFHISESNSSVLRHWYHCLWFTPNLW